MLVAEFFRSMIEGNNSDFTSQALILDGLRGTGGNTRDNIRGAQIGMAGQHVLRKRECLFTGVLVLERADDLYIRVVVFQIADRTTHASLVLASTEVTRD